MKEPFRDPEKSFTRIKRDFDKSISYAYEQTKRVENKFINAVPLIITDKNGNVLEEIDTTEFDHDFSIIVNLDTFGLIQSDLATLMPLEDEVYPWAVKVDDLEVFLLTLKAQAKNPIDFVDFLLTREDLHGKLICSDELQICGAFLQKRLRRDNIEKPELIVLTPEMADIFDKQYRKELGFKNEKYLAAKRGGKHLFL